MDEFHSQNDFEFYLTASTSRIFSTTSGAWVSISANEIVSADSEKTTIKLRF